MSSDKKNETQPDIENVEIEPLTDEDLESVPGGGTFQPTLDCSCTETGGNCTS